MAAAKKKVSRKKSTRKTATRKTAAGRKVSTKKASTKRASTKRASTKKRARKKAPARKTAAKKTAARKVRPKAKAAGEIVVTPTGAGPSIEDRILAPLSEIERLVEHIRDRADLLLSFAPSDPFNPSTWQIPSWPDIQQMFDVRIPTMDVINREKDILVRAEVPGVEKDDIIVTVTNRSITIKGASRREKESGEADLHRREIHKGSFSRTVTLPEEIEGRKAKATYNAGVVELRLPKRRVSKKHNVQLD